MNRRWSGGDRPLLGASLLLALIFGWMLLLNLSTPTWGDDWHRTLPAGDVKTVIDRIAWEYRSWTGRISVLAVTYLLLWQHPGGLLIFNLLNSAVFVGLVVLIANIAQPRSTPARERAALMVFVFSGLWFCTSGFGEAVLWKTGAIAFLWVITAAVWMLRPFVDLLVDDRRLPDRNWLIWGAPFAYAFLATSLENLSAAMSVFMLGALLLAWRHSRSRMPRWYVTAVAGQWAGTALLILAPGNFARFRMQDDGMPIYVRLPELLAHVTQHLIVIVPLLPLLGVLLVLALLRHKTAALRHAWAWLMLATLSALAMVGSTGINFGERTAFVSEVLFIVAAAILVGALLRDHRHRLVWLPVLALLIAVLIADGLRTLEQYRTVAQQTARRAELMTAYQAAGLRRILLPSMAVPYIGGLKDDHARGRFFFRDIHMDTPGNGWRNGTYAEDHGFEFALRLDRPYLIYLPELDEPTRFQHLPNAHGFRAFHRIEARGLRQVRAVYGLFDAGCHLPAELSFEWRGQLNKRPFTGDNVARVSAEGRRLTAGCGRRVELPLAFTGTVQVRVEQQISNLIVE